MDHLQKFTNTVFLIPARRNSKGLPFKNRTLIEYTIKTIPEILHSHIFVSTDDEYIVDYIGKNFRKINIIHRPEHLSSDTASMQDVLLDFNNIHSFENIIMLYLTYPERTWNDIEQAFDFYVKNNAKSILCKKEVKVSPYLMMFELDGNKGKQIIEHNLYRRQDYPKTFEISHFISIMKKDEVVNLNKNLYNDNTLFYSINDVVDVDYKEDIKIIYTVYSKCDDNHRKYEGFFTTEKQAYNYVSKFKHLGRKFQIFELIQDTGDIGYTGTIIYETE